MTKKKLLYISTVVPGSYAGTDMRAANHIMILSKFFDVTLAIVGNLGGRGRGL
jgi:hypothetical protein